MMTIIFLSTFLSLSMSEAYNDAGWIRSGDNFYLISQEKMNWFEARQFCQDHHGFLAEIKSDEEQQNVNQILQDGRDYWIGLEDFTEEGKFIWDHSKEDMEYSNWAANQPDNWDDNE